MGAKRLSFGLLLSLALVIPSFGQGAQTEGCAPEQLQSQQNTLTGYLSPDFAGDYDLAIANLFRLGALYQSMALRCGYAPSEPEIDTMLEQSLNFVTLEDLIAAQSVGSDVEAILRDLEETYGDPLAGQLLYNGLEPALGGVALGCAGCHENEAVAPVTAGTWTRINDIRWGCRNQSLQSSPVFGGKHRAADGLHHPGLPTLNAGFLRQSAKHAAFGGSCGLSR